MLKFEETAASIYEIISKEEWTCGRLEAEFIKMQIGFLEKSMKNIMEEIALEKSRVTDKLRKLDKDIKMLLKKNKMQWREKEEPNTGDTYDGPLSFRNVASSTPLHVKEAMIGHALPRRQGRATGKS